MTEVLSKLQDIFLEDFQPSDPARHDSDHPVAVAHWDRELDTWKEDDMW